MNKATLEAELESARHVNRVIAAAVEEYYAARGQRVPLCSTYHDLAAEIIRKEAKNYEVLKQISGLGIAQH